MIRKTVINNPWIIKKPTYKQAAFLAMPCREALYGGAAGGGKSIALLSSAVQFAETPGYSAILFRKTYRDLALPGGLIPESHLWFNGTDAYWQGTDHQWRFPSGATLSFGYLDEDNSRYRYQSSEFQFIGFDELTQHKMDNYLYLFSRLRKKAGVNIPLRMRAATNPGGVGHDWVKERFMGSVGDRTFIPANLQDNPYLNHDEYMESLNQLDAVTRQQLLYGDWDVVQEGGPLKRDWFQVIPRNDFPAAAKFHDVIQIWDTAFKEGQEADYSACVTLATFSGNYYVIDVTRGKMAWHSLVKTALDQFKQYRPRVLLVEEKASGISLIQALRGSTRLPVVAVPAERSKLARTTSISGIVEARRVFLPEGAGWVSDFLYECAAFPNGPHDDQVDALTHGIRYMATNMRQADNGGYTPINISMGIFQPEPGRRIM